jgi:hypothetical protein
LTDQQKNDPALLAAESGVVFFPNQDLDLYDAVELERYLGKLKKNEGHQSSKLYLFLWPLYIYSIPSSKFLSIRIQVIALISRNVLFTIMLRKSSI